MNLHILPSCDFFQRAFPKKIRPPAGSKGAYICLDKKYLGLCAQFEERGIDAVQLPNLSEIEKESILTDYVSAMGNLAELNAKSGIWWATFIASKNRFASPMPEALNSFIFCLKALKQCERDGLDLYILGITWPVIVAIEDHAKTISLRVTVHAGQGSKFFSRVRGKVQTWFYLLEDLITLFIKVLKASFYFGGIGNKIIKDKPVYIIKSFIYPSSFSDDNSFSDPFFGNLVSYLKSKQGEDLQVVTLCQGIADKGRSYRKMRKIKSQIVVPAESFLRFRDVLLTGITIIWYYLTTAFKVPVEVPFQQINLSPLLREILSSGGQKISLSHYSYRYVAKHLAKKYQLKACLMTYEGNPWEWMFILGLRTELPDLLIMGYQHSVVPQSAAGIFLSPWENNFIPHPDRIITTGKVSADILKRYSGFSNNEIYPSCALRYQYLHEYEILPRRLQESQPFTLLVALEGVVEVAELFAYAMDQARKLPEIRFIVRTHPVLSLDSILASFGECKNDLPSNVVISTIDKVADEMVQCDAVLYWGTTVSLEALMMGRPVIHFDRGDVLGYDPLFEFEDLKWVVDRNSSIQEIISDIQRLEDQEYLGLSNQGRSYVKQYLSKVNDLAMEYFLL